MMESIGGGIYGGMIFVAMGFAFAFLASVLSAGLFRNKPAELILLAAGFMFALFMMQIVAIVFFSITIMLSTLFVNLVNWSLGFVLTARDGIVIASGLTGYLFGVVPLLLTDSPMSAEGKMFVLSPQQISCLACGCLAIFVCSIAAAVYETRHTQKNFGLSCIEHPFRLNIQHLLAVTVWFSILLAFSTVAVGNYSPLVIFFLYLFFQSIIVLVDRWWQRRKKPKPIKKIQPSVHPLDQD